MQLCSRARLADTPQLPEMTSLLCFLTRLTSKNGQDGEIIKTNEELFLSFMTFIISSEL